MTSVRSDAAEAQESWFRRLINRIASGLSLRQRILLLLSLAAVPGIAVAIMLAANKLSEQTRQIETDVERLALLGAAQHEAVLDQARILLAANAKKLQAGALGQGSCALLDDPPESFVAITVPILFDASGDMVCTTGEAETLFDAAGRDWFAQALEEKDFVLGEYTVYKPDKPLLIAAYPVTGEEGQQKGVLALGIDLRWLDFIASTVELPQHMTISALNAMGELLSHNTTTPADENAPIAEPPSMETREAIVSSGEGTIRAADASGSPRVYGFAKTSDGGLTVAVGSRPYYYYFNYGDALLHTLAAPIAILIAALLAAGWAAEVFVTRHVRSLTQSAEQAGSGEWSERTEVSYDEHEIGELAEAFDDMLDTFETEHGELRKGVEQRDVLIQELNHRVKNNLQMVVSMLEMDKSGITPENASQRLATLSARVCTLAETHRLLYDRHNDEAPSLGSYTRELAKLLGEFHGLKVSPVRISKDVAMESLGMARSVPYGLILNELISNARKHAFPNGEAGTVRVSLKQERAEKGATPRACLAVTDNGVGLPEDLELSRCRSTGMRVIQALAHQLNGEVNARNREKGCAFEVRFPLEI